MNNSSRVAVMVEGALCAALSVVLSYLTIFRMPQGGSINLELVPLFIFAYRHGVKWGAEAGLLSGFLQLMFGGYVAHPVQAFLDYPLAFGVLGFSGAWKNHLITGTALGGILRLACHVASGVVFFASYAPEGSNVFVYSLTYNATFFLPQLAVNTVIALLLYRRIEKIYASA